MIKDKKSVTVFALPKKSARGNEYVGGLASLAELQQILDWASKEDTHSSFVVRGYKKNGEDRLAIEFGEPFALTQSKSKSKSKSKRK